MAKGTSAATAGSPTGKKTLRKLKQARVAQYKAERKVGKLRIRLERAESKLARRARTLGEIETQVAQHAPSAAPKASTATAPAAGKQARAKRGKKAAAAHTQDQRLEAIGLSAPVHGDAAPRGTAADHGQNDKDGHSATPPIALPDEMAPEEQDAE